ncbi:drug resistance transporter, EmrB/QacA subfamily [Gamsiella multidivaricata]|uniref:drug resistance transporter, EmrB/QacA subfamily n=1 Tax=Gamsiella multidivaricata TaxID=101098 RepID=UPI0022203805|nr:drug resistance transporter, EmrB/QacA subfamily [Gamsiella multidivaricata]KAI7821235.1 drug resistance transporter, EmrB/QacA subfamily [Gamsiella multidivaricata]
MPLLVPIYNSMFTGAMLAALDITIIATALPHIASDFSAQTQMSWVATAYLLAYTAFQPVYGRFSDIFGRKYMFLFACTIFLVASIGCGAAPSMTALILFRALQGLGGSGLFSVVIIMVSDMFENLEERARYQSLIWLAFAVSGVAGPLLGGAFVEHVTWRWCFYIGIPLTVLPMVLVGTLFNVPFEKTQLSEKMRRVDYLGVLFIVAAVLCLLLPLSWGGTTYAWNSAPIIILFCLFAVLLVVVYFIELRAGKDAVIPPALFLNRNVALAVLINGLMGMCYMGCTYYMPLYFQAVQGTSTTNSGLRMMPSTFAIVFSTITASFLLKRVRDYRVFLWVGTAIMTLGVGLFMLLDAEAGLGKQLGFVLIMGLGQGLIFQNCLLTCQECAGDEYIAVATALCGFINSVGSAVGVAICGSAFNNALVKNVAKLSPEIQEIVREYGVIENMDAISKLPGDEIRRQVVQTYADSFRFLFMVLTPIMGASFIMSLFLNKRRPAPAATEKET